MACINTLQLAETLKANSLAIPPISTGLFKVPKDIVANTIFQAVCKYPRNDEGFLQDIRIVIIDKETYEAFKLPFIDARAHCHTSTIATQPVTPFQQSHSSLASKSNGIANNILVAKVASTQFYILANNSQPVPHKGKYLPGPQNGK